MVCPPCRRNDHWNCPDVNDGQKGRRFVVVTGKNPGMEGPGPQNDYGKLDTRTCDCQHKEREKERGAA